MVGFTADEVCELWGLWAVVFGVTGLMDGGMTSGSPGDGVNGQCGLQVTGCMVYG